MKSFGVNLVPDLLLTCSGSSTFLQVWQQWVCCRKEAIEPAGDGTFQAQSWLFLSLSSCPFLMMSWLCGTGVMGAPSKTCLLEVMCWVWLLHSRTSVQVGLINFKILYSFSQLKVDSNWSVVFCALYENYIKFTFYSDMGNFSIIYLSTVPDAVVCNEPSVLCRHTSVCLPQIQLCDGKKDCPEGDDEDFCVTTCPSKGGV